MKSNKYGKCFAFGIIGMSSLASQFSWGATVAAKPPASNLVEASISAVDNATCEAVRSAVGDSGLMVGDSIGCMPINYEHFGADTVHFLFQFQNKPTLRGKPIATNRCILAARALYTGVENSDTPKNTDWVLR